MNDNSPSAQASPASQSQGSVHGGAFYGAHMIATLSLLALLFVLVTLLGKGLNLPGFSASEATVEAPVEDETDVSDVADVVSTEAAADNAEAEDAVASDDSATEAAPVATAPAASASRLAVVQSDDGAQLWMVLVDEAFNELRTVGVDTPAASPVQAHQLWVRLSDGSGMHSLGVLPYGRGASQSVPLPPELAPDSFSDGLPVLVSLEAPGGTDGGAPTGPIVGRGSVVVAAD